MTSGRRDSSDVSGEMGMREVDAETRGPLGCRQNYKLFIYERPTRFIDTGVSDSIITVIYIAIDSITEGRENRCQPLISHGDENRMSPPARKSEVTAWRPPCDRENGRTSRKRHADARSALNAPIASTQIFLLGVT